VFSVHRDNRHLEKLLANGVFVANILSDTQERVANSFAGLIPELRDNRFLAGDWSELLTGAPALDGALCNFDCRVASVVLNVRNQAALPLIFSDRTFRRLAA
jgi:flavin reductase (DIM6/NTAB) family NADH-FMN oxidoreductase RutF